MTTRREMLEKARVKDLNTLARERDIELLNEEQPKIRGINIRTKRLIAEIYGIFEQYSENKEPLPEHFFSHLKKGYGNHTRAEVRTALGILTNGRKWSYPQFNMQEAESRYCKEDSEQPDKNQFRKEKNELNKPAVRALSEIMEKYRFNIPEEILNEEIKKSSSPVTGRPYTIGTMREARRRLHMVKVEGHWIWPAPEVQYWLRDVVGYEPIAYDDLIKLGKDMGYSEEVIIRSRTASGAIESEWKGTIQYWRLM